MGAETPTDEVLVKTFLRTNESGFTQVACYRDWKFDP